MQKQGYDIAPLFENICSTATIEELQLLASHLKNSNSIEIQMARQAVLHYLHAKLEVMRLVNTRYQVRRYYIEPKGH